MPGAPHAIFFDLDNCLAPASQIGGRAFDPVFAAIRAENQGTLTPDALDAAFRDCWIHSLDVVASKHGFTAAMFDAGWHVSRTLEVHGPMRGYGDLALLPRLGEIRFLVTSGFRRLQESKVRALGIASRFERIVVDAIDEPGRVGKQQIFADLMSAYGLLRDDVLVVGDNAESELAAARRLGVRSVQLLRPGVVSTTEVTGHADGLEELRIWLDDLRQ